MRSRTADDDTIPLAQLVFFQVQMPQIRGRATAQGTFPMTERTASGKEIIASSDHLMGYLGIRRQLLGDRPAGRRRRQAILATELESEYPVQIALAPGIGLRQVG